jgi:phenylpropionate dioxygenase-like ring-hydroxylating dioxygenase large terminal subunit
MLSKEDNEILTLTGAGTPMGELFRRFWVPVMLSHELDKAGGPQKRVKVLGEDLLTFRDTNGRVGLVEPVCPHRGANLYYGRNEEGGLRCAFHGWKFDVDGHCIDLPTAPCNSPYKERIKIKSYPTREAGGLVWAYLGPADKLPELPRMEFTLLPASHVFVSKKWQDCNWAQCLEGAIDTAHFSFLHMVIAKAGEDVTSLMKHAAIGSQSTKNDRIRWVQDDPRPKFEINEFPAGLTIGGARQADEQELYWRIAQFLAPNHALVPSAFPGENYHGQTWVPASDTSCWIYNYTWNPDRPLTEQERNACRDGLTVHAKVDENYIPLRGPHNDYLLDREAQRNGSYTGIQGVSEQDAAIQNSQGPIVDRSREHLGATDIGLVRFRDYMLKRAKALASDGTEPAEPGCEEYYAVRSGGWVARADKKLKQVMIERFGHEFGHINTDLLRTDKELEA